MSTPDLKCDHCGPPDIVDGIVRIGISTEQGS